VTAWEHDMPLAFHSGREADNSPPSSVELGEWVELYLYLYLQYITGSFSLSCNV